MPAWKLRISRGVLKDLRDLPEDSRGKAALCILELAAEPFPPGTEKIQGYEKVYRVRVGDYRIVYEVMDDEIKVIAIGHRKDVYQKMH